MKAFYESNKARAQMYARLMYERFCLWAMMSLLILALWGLLVVSTRGGYPHMMVAPFIICVLLTVKSAAEWRDAVAKYKEFRL